MQNQGGLDRVEKFFSGKAGACPPVATMLTGARPKASLCTRPINSRMAPAWPWKIPAAMAASFERPSAVGGRRRGDERQLGGARGQHLGPKTETR